MKDFLTALALAMVIEGLAYAAFPEGMRAAIARAMELPPQTLRLIGLAVAVIGVLLVAAVRFAHFSP